MIAQAPKGGVFSNKEYEKGYPDGIDRSFWFLARNRIIGDFVSSMTLEGAILDVGCGRGYTVSFLRNAGYNCFGVEQGTPSIGPDLKEFVRTGQDAFNLPEKFRNQIGLILLLDIIEHLDSPEQFLNKIRTTFPNCRQVLITVPARKELWSNFDVAYGHYRRYDLPSIETLLIKSRIRVEMLGYFFHLLYPALLAQSLLGIDRDTEVHPPRFNLLQSFLAIFFRLERRLLPGFLPGSSILAVGALHQ